MTYDADDHDENPADGERIAKALARAGVASRREVERYIEDRRVAINGEVLTSPAVKVKPGDILTVDGVVVGDAEPTRVFRYHKPVGLMTSHNDPQGRPTVFAALPPGLPRLISVGRLDLNSEGLLLLTNDGALSRALELPSSGWPRTYRARAFGDATQEKLDKLKAGVTVEGVKYGPIEARLDKAKDGTQGRNVWITVTLTEGKNREVRRVLESLGLKVNRLLRLAYGPFALGDLAVGEVEEIGPRVIREQLEGLVSPQNMPKGDRPQYSGGTGKAPGRRAQSPSKVLERAAAALRASEAAKAEAKPKTEYKPGWAKPKIRASGHAPPKAGAKSGRARSEKPAFEVEKPRPRSTAADARGPSNRGRTGRVFARAEDILPGAMPRGPVKASSELRDAAAKGARRDADKKASGGKAGAGKGFAKKPFGDRAGGGKSFERAPDAPRGSGAHRTGRPVKPRSDDAALAPTRDGKPGGRFERDARPPRSDGDKRPPGKGAPFRSDAGDRPRGGPSKGPARSGPPRSGPPRSGGPKGRPSR